MSILVPPYAGTDWRNYLEINTFPYIWTAYRHRPLSGEIVMQMGVVQGATDFQIGILKVGFQYTLKTTFGGTAQIVVDVNPGPVTRRGVSFCRVEANLKGPSVDKTVQQDVYSYRPLSLFLQAEVNIRTTYALTFYGHMQIFVDAGETAYGEIITGFPKISRFGAAAAAAIAPAAAEPEDARLSALKPAKPVLTRVSLEEAYRAGADGFEGGTEAKASRPARRRK